VAKRRDRHPKAGWTFLRNHADGIAAMDLFVVPTISFRLLYGLLIVGHGRRQILWFGDTAHPTAEWIANRITEACGWEQAPRYLIRDRDGAYGEVFIRRLRSIGIRDRPTSPRSPWQNGYAERLIGSIRRECLDHVSCVQRVPPPSSAAVVHEILQWGPHASIPGERCTGLACRRSRRAHSLSPNLGRTASPIWPDLIYDRHTGRYAVRSNRGMLRTHRVENPRFQAFSYLDHGQTLVGTTTGSAGSPIIGSIARHRGVLPLQPDRRCGGLRQVGDTNVWSPMAHIENDLFGVGVLKRSKTSITSSA
jgi:hypothetical protein